MKKNSPQKLFQAGGARAQRRREIWSALAKPPLGSSRTKWHSAAKGVMGCSSERITVLQPIILFLPDKIFRKEIAPSKYIFCIHLFLVLVRQGKSKSSENFTQKTNPLLCMGCVLFVWCANSKNTFKTASDAEKLHSYVYHFQDLLVLEVPILKKGFCGDNQLCSFI